MRGRRSTILAPYLLASMGAAVAVGATLVAPTPSARAVAGEVDDDDLFVGLSWWDRTHYPAMTAHLKRCLRDHPEDAPIPEVYHDLVKRDRAFILGRREVEGFFDAAAEDGVTMLRGMAIVASEFGARDAVFTSSGRQVEEVIDAGYDIGLALPAKHMVRYFYVPDAGLKSQAGFASRFYAIFDRQYEHEFREEVLDANLEVGTGREVPYIDEETGSIETGYLVEATIWNGPEVGFKDVEGIGGTKRGGVVSWLQTILFFLPDAIDGMVIVEGDLRVEALLNQTVPDFEKRDVYRVRRLSEIAKD